MAIAYGPRLSVGIIEELSLPGVGDGVDTEGQGYQDMKEGLTLVDDLRQGTLRLRDQHDKYLPAYAEEKAQNYQRRWQSATLYNAFEETVGMLVGKAFAKPPVLGEDVPLEIAGTEAEESSGLIEDIDLQGNHFDVFAQSFFKEGLRSGLSHVLVDMTPAPPLEQGQVRTQAQVQEIGLRPYWVHIKASQVIGWQTELRGGQKVLTQVRIREQVEEPDGTFGAKKIEQIRVLHIGSYQLFRHQEGEGWQLYEQREMKGADGFPLTFIPLVTFYTDEDNGYMSAIPPLIDLAYLNVRHFQKQSDYDNCMTVACFPILYIAGFQSEDDRIAIGPQTVIRLTDPSAKVAFAEHSGNALGAARQSLEDSKEEMAMYGLRMLVSRPGASQTATQEAIAEARTSYSQLQVAVLRLKDALELALDYTAKWMGLSTGGSLVVDINDLTMNPNDVDNLLKAAGAPQKPILDAETTITELQRRGFLDENIDPKEVTTKLQQAVQTGSVASLAGSFLKPGQQTPNVPTNNMPSGTVVQ